jgi:hypothetical protein
LHAGYSSYFNVLFLCCSFPTILHFLLQLSPCDLDAQMVPDMWMTPLLESPLIDSAPPRRAMLAVKSTELSAQAAGKTSSSGRGIFDHSNSLIGSESDMTRVCSQCASGVSFQERCIVVDQVTAATRFLH